jgi:signal transduction histidine kinase/ligand-binding sensor domain-containing protein/DNA-binding response OmpR family regulator
VRKLIKRLFLITVIVSYSQLAYEQINVLRLDQITTKDGLPHNSVQSIIQDKYGLMWISSFSGLYRFDGYEFINYRPDPLDPSALISGGVYNLISDSIGNFYVAFFDTTYICRYNYDTDNFVRLQRYKLGPTFIKRIERKKKQLVKTYDTEDFHWEYSNHILIKINKKTGESKKFFTETPQNQPISDNNISVMFIDKHENLWLGTENQGIYKVNTDSKPFFSYYHYKSDNRIIIKDIIRAIHEDKSGNIWIGTFYNGVHVFNRKNNKITILRQNPDNLNNSLISNEIRCILCDSKGYVWIGTKQGLSKYHPSTKTFTNYAFRTPKSIPNNWVHAIMEDYKGSIWIGTFDGIAKYDTSQDLFIAYDPRVSLMNKQVDIILEDRYKNLWVGTQGGGVTCLKRKNNSDEFNPVHYIHNREDTNSISNNRVFSIREDKQGYIWIATEYGLNRLDPETGVFLRFTQNNNLPDEMIMGLLIDNNDNLWISHKKGLSRMNIESFEIRSYSEQDGLQSNEFSENACFKNDETGELFFGSTNGLNSFFPTKIEENHIKPEVIFTGLEILNQPVRPQEKIDDRVILSKPILFTDEINLKYSDKSFSIKFAALHYANPKSNQYLYKLDGYDKNWIKADPMIRMATYSNLPGGKYTFMAKASNNDGIWNEQPSTIKINISPPWWNNWVAYFAYFAIVILVFYLVYNYIVSREKFKNEMRYERMKMKKIVELDTMKMQFFTNVSHEFRTPLSLIIDPLRKLNQSNVAPSQAKYYYSIMHQNAQLLMRLVNQLLDIRRLETGHLKLDIRQADIVAFSRSVYNSFSLRANQRKIKYKFFSAASGITARFDPEKFEKILTNLLSNAFKYTSDGGEISVEIYQKKDQGNVPGDNGYVVLAVHDNGIGIPLKSQQKIFDRFYQALTPKLIPSRGTGIGLAYTKQLVELMKGKITVKSSPGNGSVFTVILPIGDINDKQETIAELQPETVVENIPILNADFTDSITDEKQDASEKYTILVVEDNVEVRAYLKNELQHKYKVFEANDGAEGFNTALENAPDIILSDIMMPEVSGLDLCKQIKSDERTSHIPFIMLTARQSDAYKKEGYEFGADVYVTKPFNMSVLLAIIKNLIDTRQKLKELFSNSPFIDIKKLSGNAADESFLEKAMETIEEEISNPDFNIDSLSDMLKMSRRQLTHKIKTLTGQTVLEFIKTVRLNKGAKLLLSRDYSISEVSYMLGYNVPANFSRSFNKQFGKTPSEYIDSYLE